MDRATFEAELIRENYEVREVRMAPNVHREPHTHPFDARLFILEGAFTLAAGDSTETFLPGQTCFVPAGTVHQEITDDRGAFYLAGRRAMAAAG